MSFWSFWGLTAVLAFMEWLGSWCIALKLSGQKGLISDLIAATVMVIIGLVFGSTGQVIMLQCTIPESLGEELDILRADLQDCRDYGAEVISFGDMLKSTFGMNSIIAALLLYFILKAAYYGFRKWQEHR